MSYFMCSTCGAPSLTDHVCAGGVPRSNLPASTEGSQAHELTYLREKDHRLSSFVTEQGQELAQLRAKVAEQAAKLAEIDWSGTPTPAEWHAVCDERDVQARELRQLRLDTKHQVEKLAEQAGEISLQSLKLEQLRTLVLSLEYECNDWSEQAASGYRERDALTLSLAESQKEIARLKEQSTEHLCSSQANYAVYRNALSRNFRFCEACGEIQSEDQREFDKECACSGHFVDAKQYVAKLTLSLAAAQRERDAAVASNRAEFDGHKLTISDWRARWQRMRAEVVAESLPFQNTFADDYQFGIRNGISKALTIIDQQSEAALSPAVASSDGAAREVFTDTCCGCKEMFSKDRQICCDRGYHFTDGKKWHRDGYCVSCCISCNNSPVDALAALSTPPSLPPAEQSRPKVSDANRISALTQALEVAERALKVLANANNWYDEFNSPSQSTTVPAWRGEGDDGPDEIASLALAEIKRLRNAK